MSGLYNQAFVPRFGHPHFLSGKYCENITVVPSDCPAGHYCPAGTEYSDQYPCPLGTHNNATGNVNARRGLNFTRFFGRKYYSLDVTAQLRTDPNSTFWLTCICSQAKMWATHRLCSHVERAVVISLPQTKDHCGEGLRNLCAAFYGKDFYNGSSRNLAFVTALVVTGALSLSCLLHKSLH